MRTEAKVGVLLGVVLVAAAIVFFANIADNSSDELADYEPPTTDTLSKIVEAEPAPVRDFTPDLALDPEPVPQAEPVDTSPRYYTVKKGDTLYKISKNVYGEGKHWKAIYQANKNVITNPSALQLGWKLKLPRPEELAE